jgi:arabinooligosaccharide transport system permease protein
VDARDLRLPATGAGSRLRGWTQRRTVAPYLFIAPFFLLYLAFLVGPTVWAVWLSLHAWDGITEQVWVGLRNYSNLLDDPTFRAAALNTLVYAAASLFLLMPLALALALAVNRRGLRGKDVFRLAFFIPAVLSPLVISVVFLVIFNGNSGLLNALLRGVFGLRPVAWLETPIWAKVAIIIVILWRWTGYVMIFFLAGLQAIPRDLYESAQVAGANAWQEFRYVTLPLLRPVTAFISVVLLIGAAQTFEEPYILTQGGPGDATISVSQFVYREGLTNGRFGYASAASVVLFVAIFLATYLQIRLFRIGREEVT